MDTTRNTGLIIEAPRPTDWVAGSETGMALETRNHMSDWTVFLPSDERQSSIYFDTMACVTFSALNSLEAQMRAHIAYQRLPRATIEWLRDNGYFNDRLEFNLSDRFTAKMSGTTRKGNTFVNVWDSMRKHGVLPEADWPYPREKTVPAFDWDDYYSEIPQNLKDKAKKFLDYFTISYEWVPVAAIKEHLKHAPIQIAAPTCPGWNDRDPVPACSMNPNHATMVFRADGETYDFDTYAPFRKRLAKDYPVSYSLKGVLTPKA